QTVAERRSLYVGTVRSAVRIGEMVEATLPKSLLSDVQVQILSLGDATASTGQLLYDSQAQGGAVPSRDHSTHTVTQRLAVGDHEWKVMFTPLRDPVAVLAKLAVAGIFLSSLAISVLLFWLVSVITTSESRAAELAKTNETLRAENLERKRAEEKAARFYAMVDNSTEYVSMASPDGKVFYLNPAGRRMTGIAQDADIGSINWRDLFDDENWKLRLETALPILRATGHWEGEIRMRNLETGRMLDLLVHAFKVQDPRGAPLCIATIQRDITERKLAEEDREKFVALIENSPDFIGMATLEGKPFYVNTPGRELVGLDRDIDVSSTSIL